MLFDEILKYSSEELNKFGIDSIELNAKFNILKLFNE
jgi:hypothetical protein